MKKVLKIFLTLLLCLSLFSPVNTYAATIKLNESKVELHEGETYVLKLMGVTGAVTWTSNKKSIATVTSKGKVEAVKKGTATITATFNGKKYKCNITVISNKTVDVIYGVYMIDGSTIEEYAENYKADNPDCLDVKIYDDEHIAVTIYESDRLKAISEFNATSNDYVISLLSDDSINGVFTNVEFDKLFQNIKLYADKKAYKNSPFTSFAASFIFGAISDMVQAINLINPDDRLYNISIIDNSTGEVLFPTE